MNINFYLTIPSLSGYTKMVVAVVHPVNRLSSLFPRGREEAMHSLDCPLNYKEMPTPLGVLSPKCMHTHTHAASMVAS